MTAQIGADAPLFLKIVPIGIYPVEILCNFSKILVLFDKKYISTPEHLFESDLDIYSEVITGY